LCICRKARRTSAIAGHATPSKSLDAGNAFPGKQNQDIEFAEAAWEFFKSQMK
jgi:poly(3-hydroxybutyrate) depolymerase